MSGNILVVGSYNVGLCTSGGPIPSPGETLMAEEFFQVAGGKGSNQALAAARLGASCRLLARIGNDVFGEQALQLYREHNINTDSILVDKSAHTGVGLVIVDQQGRNAISVALGANAKLSTADCDQFDNLFADCSHALFQLESPLPTVYHAIKKAKQHGACVILNPAPARALEPDIFKHVDILTPNEHEAAELTGLPCGNQEEAEQAGRALLRRGVQHVIITLGHRGSLLITNDNTWFCPSANVEAKDTTGAGDAYNGALVAELADGQSIKDAMQTAARVAAHCVMHIGVVEGLPDRSALQRIPALHTKD